MHVRTLVVDSKKDVIEQRAMKRVPYLSEILQTENKGDDIPQMWPLGHRADRMSVIGTSALQAGQFSLTDRPPPFKEGDCSNKCTKPLAYASRSGGEPGRRDCTSTRNTKGISLAVQ